jgi:outer membrane usher protein FimD/PapC
MTYKKVRQYYDSQLLKPELSIFSSSLGILKATQEENNSSLLQQLIFSSYYQQGLYKNLTVGIDLQFSEARSLIGTEIITANKAGRLNVNLGISSRKNGKVGEAARFIYHPNTKIFLTKTKLANVIRSVSFRGEYRSQYFDQLATLSQSATNQPSLQAKLQTNITFNLKKAWGASLIYGFSSSHNGKTESFANANLSKHFRQGIRWNISANYKSNDLQLQTQINIPFSRKLFGRKQDLSLRYNRQSNHLTTTYNLHRLGSLGMNSLEGTIKQLHTPNSQQISTEVHYRTHQFETHIDAQQNTLSQQLNIGINSSLLCADSTCGFSYPINDSFALIKGPANQDKPIAIKNDYGKFHYPDDSDSELPDNYNALIKNKNSPAVVLLQAYKYQRISIDEGGLPFGYDPEKTEFEFIPRYHSSYTLIAGGKSGTVVTGILVNQKKESMGFKGGQWVAEKEGGKIIAFFTNKTGRFHLPSVPAGNYQIELFDHPAMKKLRINIPDKQGDNHSLGELHVIEN